MKCLLDDADDSDAFGRALAILISEESEENYCATWLIDCEHTLWAAAQWAAENSAGDFEWGMGHVKRRTLATMLELAERSGSWVRWTTVGDGEGVRAVPLPEWCALHAEWVRRHRALST